MEGYNNNTRDTGADSQVERAEGTQKLITIMIRAKIS